jgi:predicted esterase
MRPGRVLRSLSACAAVLLLAPVPARSAPAPAGPALDKKAIEALGLAWGKARPKTKFADWDPKVREDLVARAKALGAIPEGSLGEVRDVLWKALRKDGPKGNGKMATPYGEATWIEKGGKKGGCLVLGLHGGGEGAGDAGEAAGKWTLPGCLGMYPQGIRLVHDTWNTVHGERFTLTLIEIAKSQHEVDPDRVYSMGFSMGGTGSWFLAGRHPDLLAGSAPCAGVLMAAPKSQVETKAEVLELQYGFVPNVRNLAMYYFIGLADRNCMPGTYLYAWDLLQELRSKDPGGYQNVRFTTFEGLAHAFPPGEPGKLLDWIGKQRRDPVPKKLVWEYAASPFPLPEDDLDRKVGRYVKKDFYWLRCDRPADKSYTVATIDGNVVDLSLSGGMAEDFTVFLRPGMVDVSKDVVVKVDGKEAFRGKPVPDVWTVLDTLDSRLDRGLTFDRRISLEKP